MFEIEPPKKHFVRHSMPKSSPKGEKTPSKPRSPRNKKVRPPIPTLNICFQGQDENENVQQPIKSPRNKPRNASTARSSNPRFRSTKTKTRKSPSPHRINSSGIIKNPPITADEAKSQYASALNNYEMDEISIYDEIYYLGQKSKKIKPNTTGSSNHGFDDINHHYKAIVGDQIAYRFEIRAILGKGAFGQVLRCFDHKTKKNVALKLIINTEQMREQGEVEISILQHLNAANGHENSCIIKGLDYFIFRNHICATFEILGQNLYEFSRSMHFKPLTNVQIKSIASDILTGLSFIHNNRVIHCDMKPENVLLYPGSTSKVRIIDFGSSCYIGRQKYEYIQSRFYRAPEVILGLPYGPPMDIWSFGCIIGEMMTGKPLFPGYDEAEQLEMYMEVLGLPPRGMIDECSRKRYFFHNAYRPLVRSQGRRKRRIGSLSLKALTKLKDPMLLDLLSKCFVWNQNARITAEEALKHPFFTAKEIKSARASYQLPGLRNWR